MKRAIQIYLPKEIELSGFPDSIYGAYEETPDYRIEASWTFYLMLKAQGIETCICRDYPEEGILLIHKAFADRFVWKPGLLVVSMQWDYKRDDRAQVHFVSNLLKMRVQSLGWMDRVSVPGQQYFVQPPMHPHLVPRRIDRGDRFENVAFLGAEKNLERGFRSQSFRDRVEALGMRFVIVDDPAKMNDYSEIDAVLAVRRLGRVIVHKPAQKLINAWRAGVPAILGREIGYQELHESDVDYIEVDSVEDVLQALERLKNNPELRRAMRESGLKKAEHYTPEYIETRWCNLFCDRVIPAYHGWMARPKSSRLCFLAIRRIRHWFRMTLSFIWHRLIGVKART